jgi:hypothetical protein
VPPRSLFSLRQSPSGFVFPACETCQSATRKDELLLALYARIVSPEGDYEDGSVDQQEFIQALRGVKNNAPKMMPNPNLTVRERRRALDAMKIVKPHDIFAEELGIVAVPQNVRISLQRCFRKLFLALYYRHTGKIFPTIGKVGALVTFNNIFSKPEVLNDVLKDFRFSETPKWNNSSLTDQFSYMWDQNIDEGLFAAAIGIRTALFSIVVGTTREHSSLETEFFELQLPPKIALTQDHE